MPVDNSLYNQNPNDWWDENGWLAFLRTGLNPARFGYFRSVLADRLQVEPAGKAVLDIGCGGGFLAEEFARLGCRVTGIDPSPVSIGAARAHAQQNGLAIEYHVGVGERLPFAGSSFDIACCCDVLEHVDDVGRVTAETARVLKPGAVYFYDTINRTLASNLLAIKVAQAWTRIAPPGLHDWNMFITPAELHAYLSSNSLTNQDMVGLSPRLNPIQSLRTLRAIKRGEITYGELGRRARYAASRDRSVSYMGYAVKVANLK